MPTSRLEHLSKQSFERNNTMIGLKKALFALGIGIGLSAAVGATEIPDCQTCEAWNQDCQYGDTAACKAYNDARCHILYLPGTCSM
jgi:hypothetical protein